jgi:hypothetical protein
MLGHIEMQHLPTAVFQHEEYEQYPHGDRGDGKEIDRHHLADVVAKKRLPGLAWWPRQLSEDSRDGSLRDLDAKHLEFSVKPWRTPQRIGLDHSLDEPANLDRSRESAMVPAVHPGQPGPELAKTLPLPPDDGVGLHVEQRAAPVTPHPRQTDPKQPIEPGQHWSFPLSPKGGELQPECSVLDGNGLVTAQQESNESNHRQKEGWHVPSLFVLILFPVNSLLADGIMAMNRHKYKGIPETGG